MITKKIRIQFVDTDMSGRIHYSAIFRYFEIMDHHFFVVLDIHIKRLFISVLIYLVCVWNVII